MKLLPIEGKANLNLYRHPKTGTIYFYQYKRGRRVQKSLRTDNLTLARRLSDDLRLKLLGSKNFKSTKKLVEDLFPEWIERKSVSCRPGTITSMRASWKHLKPAIGPMLPDEIDENWWEGTYIPEKRLQTTRHRKFFNDRKWLSMFLLYLKREGLIEKAPRLINPDPEREAGRAITDKEAERLIQGSDGDLRIQILMAYTMGMRWGEILGLEWDRVDFEKGSIKLRALDTKIKKPREFAMSRPVRMLLRGKFKTASGRYVFPQKGSANLPRKRDGMKTEWDNLKAKQKVFCRFHDLRHSFLTKAFKTTTNPALICHYAGLSLEEAERTYLHFDLDDTRGVAGLIKI